MQALRILPQPSAARAACASRRSANLYALSRSSSSSRVGASLQTLPSGWSARGMPKGRGGISVRSIFGGLMGKSNAAQAADDGLSFADCGLSWDDLGALVASKQQELGIDPAVDLENGAPNPLSMKRMFGTTGEPRVTLYRDHAAWCPYCQRVWMQLEEMKIPYQVVKINMRCYGDKPKSFLQKVPSGLLPVLEIDGYVITESAEIMRVLDEISEVKLIPAEAEARGRHDQLMRLERQFFSAWMQWVTQGRNEEGAKRGVVATLDAIDQAIKEAGGPYLMGEDIALVDLMIAPFLERAAASLLYCKAFRIRGSEWPHIDGWFAAMETRGPYLASKSDYFTHCHDLPPQIGGTYGTAAAAESREMIDGIGGSWDLPLPPTGPDALEPITWIEDDGSAPQHRVHAASRLVVNSTNIVRFAARGCGKKGTRPVMAPLADPTAEAGEEHLPAVDAALRHVAHALLAGPEAAGLSVGGGEANAGAPAGQAMAYLRDRVGVPRDMPLQSARQLRAHLNWFINQAAPSCKHAVDIKASN